MKEKTDENKTQSQSQQPQQKHRELFEQARKAKGGERERLEQAALEAGVDKFVQAGSTEADEDLVNFITNLLDRSATIRTEETTKLMDVMLSSQQQSQNQVHNDYKAITLELLRVAEVTPSRSDEVKDALLNKVDWRSIRGDADTRTVLESLAIEAGLQFEDDEIKELTKKAGAPALGLIYDSIHTEEDFSAFTDALNELRESGSVEAMSTLRDIAQDFYANGPTATVSERTGLSEDEIEDELLQAASKSS